MSRLPPSSSDARPASSSAECATDGCTRPRRGRGDLCNACRQREWRRARAADVAELRRQPLRPPADLTRFQANRGEIDLVTGCQEWTGTTLDSGYGVISYGSVLYLAHRLAYAVEHGEVPADAWVLHTCDNPPCTAREHIYLGDQLLNEHDKAARGRNYGTRHGSTKLTPELVVEARDAWHAGALLKDLCREYGLSTTAMHHALVGNTWSHEPGARRPRTVNNQVRGERVARAIVTAEQVREIRALYAAGGWSHATLGARYGITKSGIKAIVRRETWKHVV